MAQIQLQLCRLGLHIFSAMSHCWSDSWEGKWSRPQEVPEGVKYQQHTKNYRCQLAPKEPPEFPSTQDLFGASASFGKNFNMCIARKKRTNQKMQKL